MKRMNATVALRGRAAQSGRSRMLRSGLSAMPEHDIRASAIYDFRTMQPSGMRAAGKKDVDLARKRVDN
jgi:hypothetical protein